MQDVWRVYDMNIEIVRFYNVYGPKEIVHGEWAAVIGIWRSQIKNNLSLTIVGDGEQREILPISMILLMPY